MSGVDDAAGPRGRLRRIVTMLRDAERSLKAQPAPEVKADVVPSR
jgi:hypothetical protein